MPAPDFSPEGRLGELLESWRRDILSVPIPPLVDLATAVALVTGTGKAPDEVTSGG
ncbi:MULTISPECIES: hypothetical protein [Amycolatopsis]|uniref:Uncharacterized protein n=2 Tax=Amycolatopsis TaxID=1813 RepID=A0A1I4DF98_9PSEU|nr:hypothetical protein [Amycolatopsis sacchari]SFK90796.1 hypothetical protein SAMN05421835_1449 [Amycolatopsis sacchari]